MNGASGPSRTPRDHRRRTCRNLGRIGSMNAEVVFVLKILVSSIQIASLYIFIAVPTQACSCIDSTNVERAREHADVVFQGVLASRSMLLWGDAIFRVGRVTATASGRVISVWAENCLCSPSGATTVCTGRASVIQRCQSLKPLL